MFNDVKVGDELYLVTRSSAQPVKVAKKGRKWFYVDVRWMGKSRFSLASGSLESEYSQNTRCWKSKEEYDEVCLRSVLWEQIQRWFRNNYRGPDKITKEQMYEIAKIVGIELSETPGDPWRR